MNGFALFEVLITLLVVSLALLGIVGMQVSAVHYAQEAYLHSVATTQLANMLERLRTNTSLAARAMELERWNDNNARLLPRGRGEYRCIDYLCTVDLSWFVGTTQTATLSAQI